MKCLSGGLLGGLGGGGALLETVLESAGHGAKVSHAASALRLPALSLHTPVVCSNNNNTQRRQQQWNGSNC
jgi:hypothetical protein